MNTASLPRKTPSFCALTLAVLACAPGAFADVIYRETFGRPAVNSNLNPTNFGWSHWNGSGQRVTGANGVNGGGPTGTQVGKPTDVANINAGPNSDGTTNAYATGWHYFDGTTRFTHTAEYTIDPADYVAGTLIFKWHQGNAYTTNGLSVAIRIGNTWYASAQRLSNTVTFTADTFGGTPGAEPMSLTYHPAASNWLTLNFNGSFDPLTGSTTNSSTAMSLGAAPGADLSGEITAFGLYRDHGNGQNSRFDTFTIEGTVVPVAPQIVVDLTNQTAQLCGSATFSIQAIGSEPLDYYWHIDNAFVPGNQPSLTVSNTLALNGSPFFVIVSNNVNTATSAVATLTLADSTVPAILQCATNQTLLTDGSCQAVLPNLTGQIVATDCSGIASITQSPIAGTVLNIGTQIVTFSVSDGSNNIANCNATILVTSPDLPTIVSCAPDQFLNANTNQQATIPDLTGLVVATNSCGTPAISQSPAPGTIVGPGAHVVTFTIGTGNTTNCTATVNVNGHPIAVSHSTGTLVNTPLALTLGGSDPEGPLSFAIVGLPGYGSLGTLNSNEVTYTPDEGYVGLDSFTFNVTDGLVTSLVATVTINVTNFEILFPTGPQITNHRTTVLVEDFATLPLSGRGGSFTNFGANVNFGNQLGRVNFLRSEPPDAPLAAARLFLCDNNRNFYIFDKAGSNFTAYINFQAVLPKFDNDPGYAGGLVSFAFDPAYATNGKFYTVHTEDPAIAGSAEPLNINLPGLDTNGYTTTTVINPPMGSSFPRQSILIEWTDTNITNDTFEGTARELLRVGFNSNIHPLGDLLFNPLAQPGDWDYGNLYVANGDGGAGESSSTRQVPQRLDALQGKILRITPDLNLRPADELSASGRYRIPTTGPDPNPFISLTLTNLKKEIWAYGFRNCHRISWDEVSNKILECDIGLHAWEEVNILHKGGNYGYSEREGTEQLFVGGANNGKTGSQAGIPFPTNDTLIVAGLSNPVAPLYPAAQYSHEDGDAIASGFVYRGSLLPQLKGKYIFGEITTGRLLYCDLAEMIAMDEDGLRTTVANILELKIVFRGSKRRLFDVISDEYHARGGTSANALPGSAGATAGNDIDGVPYGRGRADIRLAVDNEGELYVLSKSDGMIRKLTAVLVPPTITSITRSNGAAELTWVSVSNEVYRVQYKDSLTDTNWTDLSGDVTAAGATATKLDPAAVPSRFYRVFMP